jgi:phosphinothricin acetyltransferase
MEAAARPAADLARAMREMDSARRTLIALTAPLSPDDLARGRAGGWTVARVLAHVIESEWIYVRLMAHMAGKDAPAGIPEIAEVSAEPASGAEAVDRLTAVRAAMTSVLDGIDEARIYQLSRFGHEEFSPLSLVENIAMHDGEHHAQIATLLLPDRAHSARHVVAPTDVVVRPAVAADVPRLTEIYNDYIVHTPTTFDLEPLTVDQRLEWFGHYAPVGRHRLLVAERDGAVLGYTSTSRFRQKQAYETTVEMSIICAPEAVGQGIGQRLYEVIFDAIATEDIHAAIAAITLPNDASCALHERFGFRRVAVLPEVGRKFGRYWDVAWYARVFD